MRSLKELESENDYELVDGSVWITTNKFSIWIMPFGDSCVRTMIFEKGQEMNDALDEMLTILPG